MDSSKQPHCLARTRKPSGAGSSARWDATDPRCRPSACASCRSRGAGIASTRRSTRRTCSSAFTPGSPSETLGDMNYEHEFTNDSYVNLGNGIRFPTGWHSHQGWDDNFGAQAVSAGHNAFGGTLKDVRANVCPDADRRSRRGARRELSDARRDRDACRRRLPDRRWHPQQHRRRVRQLHRRLRRAAQ